jgi:hypothetical protein
VDNYIAEVLKGDYYEGDPTVAGVLTSVGLGFTPLGWAADYRDTTANLTKLVEGPERVEPAVNAILSGLGLIPLGGDVAKWVQRTGVAPEWVRWGIRTGRAGVRFFMRRGAGLVKDGGELREATSGDDR